MAPRAKFYCAEVKRNDPPNDDTLKVVLRPVTSGSEENRTFFKYTPGGEITLQVVGTDTAAQFQVGHDYYVDFTEVVE